MKKNLRQLYILNIKIIIKREKIKTFYVYLLKKEKKPLLNTQQIYHDYILTSFLRIGKYRQTASALLSTNLLYFLTILTLLLIGLTCSVHDPSFSFHH